MCAAIAAVACATGEAGAMGSLRHPGAEERAALVRGILYETASGAVATRTGPFVEVSEAALYGIPGLHASGFRAGAGVRTPLGVFCLDAEAARLAADVGTEHRLAVTPAVVRPNRWAASLGVAYESAAIDGMAPACLVTLTARALVEPAAGVAIGGEVSRYRVGGEPLAGADVSVALVFSPVPVAVVRAVVSVDRFAGASPAVSTTVRAGRILRLTMGYESGADALRGALSVTAGGVTCAAGADYVPALGVREAVTLSWGR